MEEPSTPSEPTSDPKRSPSGAASKPPQLARELTFDESTWNAAPQVNSYESMPHLSSAHLGPPERRIRLPLILFALTCVSTFWAGITDWQPHLYLGDALFNGSIIRGLIWQRGIQGLIYMTCVLSILMAHEMGHFIATIRHRVPASLPFFIPFPIAPIGTMGAVIGMDGRLANRKQIFDIGIAGPLAGLVFAVPILIYGVSLMDFSVPPSGSEAYDCPISVRWMIQALHPQAANVTEIRSDQLNPYFMAGWVGFLITGLNMLPVSQLDGGHVIYALFGRNAHWIARGFIFFAISFIVFQDATIWAPMTLLVILMGTDHPPTANDKVKLGTFRIALGLMSLAIPLLCFPPHGLVVAN